MDFPLYAKYCKHGSIPCYYSYQLFEHILDTSLDYNLTCRGECVFLSVSLKDGNHRKKIITVITLI